MGLELGTEPVTVAGAEEPETVAGTERPDTVGGTEDGIETGTNGGRFWPWLTLWTALGLAIRLATVFGRPNRAPGGDPGYAWGVANLLVAGKGFINPLAYGSIHPITHSIHNHHQILQTAGWPPLWTFFLTIPPFFGFHSFYAARIWSCIVGAGVIVVCGLAGREIAGRRVGLIAALLIAVYPNIWMNDELALSEALSPLCVALVLWATYRFYRRPTRWNVAALGASVGLAALCRDELALLAFFIVVPVVLLVRADWRKRLGLLAIAATSAAVLVLPWVGYNFSRFDDPVYISDGLGPTLASANCGVTYSGLADGYWSFLCMKPVKYKFTPTADESVNFAKGGTIGMNYIRSHTSELPGVVAARIGRGFGFFRPLQQLRFDALIETKPYHWALTGLVMYYVLLALSVGGTILLRLRRVLVFPLWAVAVDVLAVFILSFGQTRYRVTFEVSLVLLAAVQIEWFWSKAFPSRNQHPVADQQGAPDPPLRAEPVPVEV
jgi:4-amino-4-deoxy-L-arabinose transferase-like glycosyltransferase